MKNIRVAIIGATGYTGLDTIEILFRHKYAEPTYLTASSNESVPVSFVHPRLVGRLDLDIEPLDFDKLAEVADVALCCLPHKVSMSVVPLMLEKGLRVVDFSADYRIKDVSLYEEHYVPHTDPANIDRAVYGLPELYRDQIVDADLVANPGCFPTSAILGLAPLLNAGLINPVDISVNSVSGATGAGKTPSAGLHFPNLNENLRAYNVGTHRHMPEMEQICSDISGGDVRLLFQPHIGSFDRGILSTIYCTPVSELSSEKIMRIYNDYYEEEPFVHVINEPPHIKSVANTNYCQIYPAVAKGKVVIFSVIDNLIKGASGQAIQNMNVMYGFDEREGLL